jgi:HSP20 family protein
MRAMRSLLAEPVPVIFHILAMYRRSCRRAHCTDVVMRGKGEFHTHRRLTLALGKKYCTTRIRLFSARDSKFALLATLSFCSYGANIASIFSMGVSPFHGIFSSLGQDQKPKEPTFQLPEEAHVSSLQPSTQSSSSTQMGRVAVDIYEQDDYYIIKAPIAGVRLSDLDIEVNDNVLTVRGVRRQTDTVQPEQYYLQECFWGNFSRSVTLPITIDPRKVRATFNKECILKILVPKEEKVKIVKINEI